MIDEMGTQHGGAPRSAHFTRLSLPHTHTRTDMKVINLRLRYPQLPIRRTTGLMDLL